MKEYGIRVYRLLLNIIEGFVRRMGVIEIFWRGRGLIFREEADEFII